MTFREVDLPPEVPGTLWLAAMPARMEPWPEFEARARRRNITLLVCLTPRNEVAELSPVYDRKIGQPGLPFRWELLEMPNFGVPRDREAFRSRVEGLAVALQRGEGVLLHCAAGLGRTGSTAACVLKALGLESGEALRRVRAAGSNPQNAAQSGFVDWF